MSQDVSQENSTEAVRSFFEQPNVQVEWISIGDGIPLGIERRSNPEVGIGGAYGAWGESYDNETLLSWIAQRLGEPLHENDGVRGKVAGKDCGQPRGHRILPFAPALDDGPHLGIKASLVDPHLRILQNDTDLRNVGMGLKRFHGAFKHGFSAQPGKRLPPSETKARAGGDDYNGGFGHDTRQARVSPAKLRGSAIRCSGRKSSSRPLSEGRT